MSEKQFKFVSPGTQIIEIDLSSTPREGDDIGPVVIGRAQRGPAMRPVKVNSNAELIEIFGNPTPTSEQSDVWRDNAILGPTYGILGAQASLKNKSALTFIRLLGTEHAEANSTTGAGKAGWKIGSTSIAETTGPGGGGGAYGLFIFPSASSVIVTGTLAAVFYLQTGSLTLSGTRYGNNSAVTEGTGTAGMFMSNDNKQFRVFVKNSANGISDDLRFDFTPSSDKFIRKVANTNPTRLNSSLYATTKNYFLGESFEDFINESEETAALRSATTWVGVILGIKNAGTSDDLTNRQLATQNSRTGWFFAQDVGTAATYQYDNMQKLFRFHSLDSGEWNQANLKISLRNIRVSSNDYDRYGSFDVVIRSIDDSDSSLVIYEQFTNCNLNPRSANYVGRKIGDKYNVFSTTTNRNMESGEYDNNSKFIRIEVATEVSSEVLVPELLPFGVYGPLKFRNFAFASGSLTSFWGEITNVQTAYTSPFVVGSGSIPQGDVVSVTGQAVNFGIPAQGIIKTASVVFPQPRLRKSTTSGTLGSPKSAFFGVYTDDTNQKFSKGVKDLVRILPQGVDSFAPASSKGTDFSFVFSLDDIKLQTTTDVQWESGSRLAGTSITSLAGNTYQSILSGGFNAFTTFLAGGFDGMDIREIEPFNNTDMSAATAKTSYAYNTVQRAIELLRDPEDIDFNVAAIPGVSVPGLTGRLIEVCEERGDAIAIIDIENDFAPRAENSNDNQSRRTAISVSSAIASLKTRGLNSNYGAAYFPWVQAREPLSNNLIFIPPTVPVLGAFAYNDKVGAKWYAPAGFNRGSLTAGHGGIPVINVAMKLNKKDRDDLYLANVNPISVLEGEIVIFGQKTLQVRPSALDRVNVRRALLDIKKKISKISSSMLFEPNVEATWGRFRARAEPILRDIVAKNGLEEYKLKLDGSTTTPDLQDRNIIYGKLYLKPVKTAEYIGFDFNITNSGASFADL